MHVIQKSAIASFWITSHFIQVHNDWSNFIYMDLDEVHDQPALGCYWDYIFSCAGWSHVMFDGIILIPSNMTVREDL